MPLNRPKAFSLIELLYTLALLSLFAFMALPAFGQLIEANRIQSLYSLLYRQLYQARASSILHNRDIEVCGSRDGLVCDDHWESGWLVRDHDSGEPITQHRLAPTDHLNWSGATARIRFRQNGTAPLGNGRFYLCDRKAKVVLQIVLNRQGRMRRVSGLESTQDPQMRCS
ncbi:GspH/FimT family pseudopilin [Pseudomonas sp. UL073]|uniref:Type II secretion system protein H n=1 Tax=Zestomonas insulae TaxID=2809017 RepID=A0ABS2IK30_9GAMM|nr:GspH/FimT family pseudopilin [Pseudomonas insulae]MBM7063105.1 GspH/FimT family pseudopilin [Pseudomonas insulae]